MFSEMYSKQLKVSFLIENRENGVVDCITIFEMDSQWSSKGVPNGVDRDSQMGLKGNPNGVNRESRWAPGRP